MSVSPADFELYSRVTGTPLPRTPQEQMQMAPMVHHFTRNYLRQPQQPNFFQETAENLGKLALLGLAGGAVYGLARQGGQKTPETPAKGQIGTVNSATVDLNPDYSPPTVESGPEFDVQGDISSPAQQSDFYITEKDADTALVEQPTDEIVVVDDSQPAITTPQVDPRSFLGEFANNLISKAQEEVDAFDAGIDWGDTLDQAASADSPVEGALILGGGVARKGFHDVKTRIGKDINTAGNIVSEAVDNIKKIPAAMQEVDSVIANEQMKASVMPDNKMQETTYLNPPVEGTGGVEIGIESDLSDTPQFDDTHQANEQASFAGLNRQTGLTTSSTTNLNPDLVRETARQLDGVPVSQDVKEAVAAEKLANPAQSVSYLLKSVLAGLTGGEQPTFPGKNPDEGLEDLIGAPAPATSTRMANVGGNFYPVEDSKFVEGLTTYPVSGERAGQVDFHLRNKSTGELNPYGYQVNDALNVALGDMGEEGSLNKESMGQLYNFLRKNPDLMRGV